MRFGLKVWPSFSDNKFSVFFTQHHTKNRIACVPTTRSHILISFSFSFQNFMGQLLWYLGSCKVCFQVQLISQNQSKFQLQCQCNMNEKHVPFASSVIYHEPTASILLIRIEADFFEHFLNSIKLRLVTLNLSTSQK